MSDLLNLYRFHRSTLIGVNADVARRWSAHTVQRVNLPAREALQRARADVQAGAVRYSPTPPTYNPPWKSGSSTLRIVEKPEQAGIRKVADADKLARIRHTGWFMDPDGSGDTVRGAVYQLPARNGRACYVPGFPDPFGNDAAILCFDDMEQGHPGGSEHAGIDGSILRDVAYRADHIAEHYAEDEREYQRAYQAGAAWADRGEDAMNIRLKVRGIIADLRTITTPLPAAICATLRAAVKRERSMLEEIRVQRAKLAEGKAISRRDDYGCWNTHEKRLRGAFNEAAGRTVVQP